MSKEKTELAKFKTRLKRKVVLRHTLGRSDFYFKLKTVEIIPYIEGDNVGLVCVLDGKRIDFILGYGTVVFKDSQFIKAFRQQKWGTKFVTFAYASSLHFGNGYAPIQQLWVLGEVLLKMEKKNQVYDLKKEILNAKEVKNDE